MRAAAWVPILVVLSGCAALDRFYCPSGEDCSYSLAGVTGTAVFAAPWNATQASDALVAAGWPAPQRNDYNNATYLFADLHGDRATTAQAGPLPGGGSLLAITFVTGPGHVSTRAQVRAQANATWPRFAGAADATLAKYENATGWRHEGAWNVTPLEAIR